MTWGKLIAGVALLATAASANGAAPRKRAPAPSGPAQAMKSLVQNCDAHKFETTIQLVGPDGQRKSSKVKMCGTEGQNDAEWLETLKDAVKKTAESPQMPKAVKEQIIAAANAEIGRLSAPKLELPSGGDIANLPKDTTAAASDTQLTRDYSALPPLPTASSVVPPHLLGSDAAVAPVPRLTLRCALVGDEDRASDCDSIDRDTVLVFRADEPYPRGASVRFVRHGDTRAELAIPALRQGQSASLRIPPRVCSGVVRSRVEIRAVSASAPAGAPAGTIGEYDLRC
jgi:hypothetical protein